MEYETPISSAVAHPINQSNLSNLSIHNHPKTVNLPAVHSTPNPQRQDSRRRQRVQSHQQEEQLRSTYVGPPSPSLSALDFMHLPSEIEKEQQLPSFMPDQGIFPQPGVTHQDLSEDTMQGLDFGMHGNGWNADLPSYIDELLSGAYMY
jgi:hypothetical protein